jgi:hypothetical protein
MKPFSSSMIPVKGPSGQAEQLHGTAFPGHPRQWDKISKGSSKTHNLGEEASLNTYCRGLKYFFSKFFLFLGLSNLANCSKSIYMHIMYMYICVFCTNMHFKLMSVY